jgi:hypothetical protein
MRNINNRSLGYYEIIVTLVQLLHFSSKHFADNPAYPVGHNGVSNFFYNYYPQPTDTAAGVQNFQDKKQPMKLRHAAGTEFQKFTRQADVLIPK